jgi:hypothetical protein
LVVFLRSQERTKYQQKSVDDAVAAVNVALLQYKAGTTDFTTVTQVEQIQVLQQDTLAIAQGEIVTGLVAVYRALGGGWQIRCNDCQETLPPKPCDGQAVRKSEELFLPPSVMPQDQLPAPQPLPAIEQLPPQQPEQPQSQPSPLPPQS